VAEAFGAENPPGEASDENRDREALKKEVEDHPDDYQYERAARFNVSQRGIGEALKRLKISLKKNLSPSQSGPRSTTRVQGTTRSLSTGRIAAGFSG